MGGGDDLPPQRRSPQRLQDTQQLPNNINFCINK